MKGTEKQITWAQDIITNATETINRNIEITEQRIAEGNTLFAADLTAWHIVKAFVANAMKVFGEDAGQVINRRNQLAGDALIKLAHRMANDIRTGKTTADQIAAQLHVSEY